MQDCDLIRSCTGAVPTLVAGLCSDPAAWRWVACLAVDLLMSICLLLEFGGRSAYQRGIGSALLDLGWRRCRDMQLVPKVIEVRTSLSPCCWNLYEYVPAAFGCLRRGVLPVVDQASSKAERRVSQMYTLPMPASQHPLKAGCDQRRNSVASGCLLPATVTQLEEHADPSGAQSVGAIVAHSLHKRGVQVLGAAKMHESDHGPDTELWTDDYPASPQLTVHFLRIMLDTVRARLQSALACRSKHLRVVTDACIACPCNGHAGARF